MMETDDSFVHLSQLFQRPRTYRAPTFSWAAIDGEIDSHELPKTCAHVEAVMIDLPAQTPYGWPKHGSLSITGAFRMASSCGPFKEDVGGIWCPCKAGYIPLYDDDGWPFGYLLPDSQEDVDERKVFCFKLGVRSFPVDIFLVLVSVLDENTTVPRFRRIGLGKTREQETRFFAEAEVRTIELF